MVAFSGVHAAEDASEEAAPHRTKKEVRCFHSMVDVKHLLAFIVLFRSSPLSHHSAGGRR